MVGAHSYERILSRGLHLHNCSLPFELAGSLSQLTDFIPATPTTKRFVGNLNGRAFVPPSPLPKFTTKNTLRNIAQSRGNISSPVKVSRFVSNYASKWFSLVPTITLSARRRVVFHRMSFFAFFFLVFLSVAARLFFPFRFIVEFRHGISDIWQ